MPGVIYVCGLYGAGKTTLVRAALDQISGLRPIVTYTTRAPREGETNSDYVFVTKDAYEELRLAKPYWDHTEINGEYYGADADLVNDQLERGLSFIVAATMDIGKLKAMQRHYLERKTVILIDTPLEICNERVLSRDGEQGKKKLADRDQSQASVDRMRTFADHVFIPSLNLDEDMQRFVQFINEILLSW